MVLRLALGAEVLGYVSSAFTAKFDGEEASARLAKWIGIFTVPVLVVGMLKSIISAGGWAALASPEFKAAYSHGLHGHIRVLCEPLEVLLIGTATKKRKAQLGLAGLMAFFSLVGQVKGAALQPVIAGLFYRFMRGRSSLSFRSVGVIILSGVFVFGAIYLVGWSIIDPSAASSTDTYLFLARHFYFYVTSGVLGFSEVFRAGTNHIGASPVAIFTPFLNLYRVFTGAINMSMWGSSSDTGVQIALSNDPSAITNVYSFFGTLYIYLGATGAVIYVIVVALLCYTLWILAGWTRNEWILVLYCIVAAELFFGYFELYFWLIDPYEIALYVGILAMFSSLAKTPPIRSWQSEGC